MARTLVLFAALILSLAAAYFSFSHLNKAIAVQETNIELLTNIKKLKREISDTSEIITKQDEVKGAAIDLQGEREGNLQVLQGEISSNKAELPRRQEKIERQKSDLENYDQAIAKIKEALKGVGAETPEEIEQAVQKLQQDKIAVEKELEEVQTAVVAAEEGVNSRSDTLGRLNKTVNDRRVDIASNTRESTITAVNPDWGFVVVGSGKSQGLNADQSLLVKRGNTYIARLAVVSLEQNQLIADIVPESIAPGARVLPGDRVIIERPKG